MIPSPTDTSEPVQVGSYKVSRACHGNSDLSQGVSREAVNDTPEGLLDIRSAGTGAQALLTVENAKGKKNTVEWVRSRTS